MADPVSLSGSSLGCYKRCPYWWYLEYVENEVRPPRLQMARGLAGHEAIEQALHTKLEKGQAPPPEQITEFFMDLFVEYARESPEKQGQDTKADVFRRGVLAIEAWCRDIEPDIDPLYVEVGGQFDIDGITYTWTADLITKDLLVKDWKFVKRKPQVGSDWGPDYTRNMQGYVIGARTALGLEEAGYELDYIVCTLDPYLVQATYPPLTDEDIDEFRDDVVETHARIMDMQFPPLGLGNNSCSWCPFADGTCEYYRRNHAND